jgi:STE24 endopeptidase
VHLWRTSVPSGLRLPHLDAAREIPPAQLHRAESFEAFVRWSFLASQVVLVAVLAVYAKRGARLMRESAAGPIGTGFLLGMLGLGLVWLAQLPFGIADFWWAKHHHVLTVGWVEFLFGGWFALGSAFAFLCLALLVAMGFARLLARTWWVPASAVFVALTVLFSFVMPWLSNVREPRGPQLRAQAAEIARSEGVPDVPLRVESMREVTDQPNAYAMGLGPSRRVVLWDTIVSFPRRELRVVIAHEYAHQARRHIAKSLGWSAILLLPTALIVALATRRRGGLGRPEAVPLALLVYVLVTLAATPIQSAISRRHEAEADWTALETTRDPAAMQALFRRFTKVALADPDPPGWFHVLFDDHPTGLQRIAMARAWTTPRAE